MVPSSTKEPSGKRSTRESSTAASPGSGSPGASPPPGGGGAARVWLGVGRGRARGAGGGPGAGPALPRNSRANTSSRMRSEHDEAARQLAGGEGAERLVGLLEPVAAIDELVDTQPSREIEARQHRQVLAGARAAVGGAADLALRRYQRAHVQGNGGSPLPHPHEAPEAPPPA